MILHCAIGIAGTQHAQRRCDVAGDSAGARTIVTGRRDRPEHELQLRAFQILSRFLDPSGLERGTCHPEPCPRTNLPWLRIGRFCTERCRRAFDRGAAMSGPRAKLSGPGEDGCGAPPVGA